MLGNVTSNWRQIWGWDISLQGKQIPPKKADFIKPEIPTRLQLLRDLSEPSGSAEWMAELCEMDQKLQNKEFPKFSNASRPWNLVCSFPQCCLISVFSFCVFFFNTCDILWHLLNSALMGMERELDSCLGRIIGRIHIWGRYWQQHLKIALWFTES